MAILEKIDAFYVAREEYERLTKMVSDAYRAMKGAEHEAVDAMLNEGTKSIGRDDGTHVSLRQNFSCSVTIDNEDQIREWLVSTTGDDAQFIVEKVHKPALIEWLKERFKVARMDDSDVPDFLNLNTHPGLSVRGWKTRQQEQENG